MEVPLAVRVNERVQDLAVPMAFFASAAGF